MSDSAKNEPKSREQAIQEAPSPPKEFQLRRRDFPSQPMARSWNRAPAWLISTVFHVFLLVLLVALWQPISRGTGDDAERAVGIALVRETNSGSGFLLLDTNGSSDSNAAAAAAAANSGLPTDDGPPVSLDALLSDLTGDSIGNLSAAEASLATGGVGLSGSGATGSSRDGMSKGSTNFLGVQGEGNSFVYVLDRSDSMNSANGRPLQKAKREVAESLASLQANIQFQIVFYNEVPVQFRSGISGARNLIFADDNEKQLAAQFVNGIRAYGGTEHVTAIKYGLDFKPEVLFFMTDANEPALSPKDMNDIIRRCGIAGTTIHTIEFGTGAQQNDGGWLKRLAEKTNGQYRYVDVSQI